ncbi:MAG: hypothetical protein U0Q16_28670 [Bryobacteraceae bacterium]
MAACQPRAPCRGVCSVEGFQLLELIALLEAGIDFAEDDVDVAGDSEITHNGSRPSKANSSTGELRLREARALRADARYR